MTDYSIFIFFMLFIAPLFLLWFIKKLVVSAIKEIKNETKKISRKASRANFSKHSLSAPINYAPALTRGGFRI